MDMHYFRRYRMEIDLREARLAPAVLPEGYQWLDWDSTLLQRHAYVKYCSFRSEIDANVFQCLGNYDGCLDLMQKISSQRTFVPAATWLISTEYNSPDGIVDCGTIQGMAPSRRLGAVQNVGIVETHRNLGLGRALVLKSLEGFRQSGVKRVYLEVTADNFPAVGLYHSIGFRLMRTMFKAVPMEQVQSCPI